jgi:hypothetical protein
MLEEDSQTTKELSSILSPNQYRTISEIIFSGSAQKSNKSRTSEKRYSKLTQNFDVIDIENQEDQKPGKLLTYKAPKTRHRRKSSAGEIQCEKKWTVPTSNHSRNISDADSVIHKTEESVKKLHTSLRGSLPILESTPCTAFCPYCKIQVHTSIELYSQSFSKKVISLFASILSCCEAPWLSNMKVHKCPHCSLVLGRVGIIN